MSVLIIYAVVALVAFFIMVAYNEATIANGADVKDEMFIIAILWPIPLAFLVIIAPFWGVYMLARWFGRNYL